MPQPYRSPYDAKAKLRKLETSVKVQQVLSCLENPESLLNNYLADKVPSSPRESLRTSGFFEKRGLVPKRQPTPEESKPRVHTALTELRMLGDDSFVTESGIQREEEHEERARRERSNSRTGKPRAFNVGRKIQMKKEESEQEKDLEKRFLEEEQKRREGEAAYTIHS